MTVQTAVPEAGRPGYRHSEFELLALKERIARLQTELWKSRMQTKSCRDRFSSLKQLVKEAWQGQEKAVVKMSKIIGAAVPRSAHGKDSRAHMPVKAFSATQALRAAYLKGPASLSLSTTSDSVSSEVGYAAKANRDVKACRVRPAQKATNAAQTKGKVSHAEKRRKTLREIYSPETTAKAARRGRVERPRRVEEQDVTGTTSNPPPRMAEEGIRRRPSPPVPSKDALRTQRKTVHDLDNDVNKNNSHLRKQILVSEDVLL